MCGYMFQPLHGHPQTVKTRTFHLWYNWKVR